MSRQLPPTAFLLPLQPVANLVPPCIARLVLDGEIREATRTRDRLERRDKALAAFKDAVRDELPADVHPFLDFHESAFNPDDEFHEVSILAPGLCEVRTTWEPSASSESGFAIRPAQATRPAGLTFAVVPSDRATPESWEWTSDLAHALFLAARRAARQRDRRERTGLLLNEVVAEPMRLLHQAVREAVATEGGGVEIPAAGSPAAPPVPPGRSIDGVVRHLEGRIDRACRALTRQLNAGVGRLQNQLALMAQAMKRQEPPTAGNAVPVNGVPANGVPVAGIDEAA